MKDKKNIEFKENGLVCDNTECDWENPNIPDGELEQWIDVECPKCGDNILTKQDYLNYKLMMVIVDEINDIDPNTLAEMASKIDPKALKDHPLFEDVEGLELLVEDPNKPLKMTINTHGTLKVDKITPVVETDEEE
tara:strand:+ start:162 stop:569 length:408 start_codon:yes stop_codon:yes gene_type:complete